MVIEVPIEAVFVVMIAVAFDVAFEIVYALIEVEFDDAVVEMPNVIVNLNCNFPFRNFFICSS
jgi:hypothetical protein